MNLRRDVDQAVAVALHAFLHESSYRKYAADASPKLIAELGRRASSTDVSLFSSATAGLEATLRAAGIGPESVVAISAYDYPGNMWAIERVGARPILIDTQLGSWAIDGDSLAEMVASGRVQAAIVSHLHGQMQNVAPLLEICDANDVLLIEDACQSIGAVLGLEENRVLHGHVGLVSFGGGKVISSGRGGAVMSSDLELAHRIRIAAGAGSGPYALSELQSATVSAQLPWLEKIDRQCDSYFSDFASNLLRHSRAFMVPWYAENTHEKSRRSFYQAGVICQDEAHVESCLQTLVENGILAGHGFNGFHRRSKRRCDRAGLLASAGSTAGRTVVVHHDIALNESLTPAELANLFCSASE